MQFEAKARYVRFSPFKLRPLADVIRGKNVQNALNFLTTCSLKKARPLQKMIESAAANAKSLQNIDVDQLAIKEIRVDQGPTQKYFKPGAMGRTNIYRKRFSHLSVVLEPIKKQEA